MVAVLPGFGHWAYSIRDFDTPYGRIGFRQASILYRIRYNPELGLTPGDLAVYFEVQPSVITRALARLEANGFIARLPDAEDRRRHRLGLTEKGREVSTYVEELYIREMMKSTAFLTDAQAAELRAWMKTLHAIVLDLESRRKLGMSDLQTGDD